MLTGIKQSLVIRRRSLDVNGSLMMGRIKAF